MDVKEEYYDSLAGDLVKAGLSENEIVGALMYNVTSDEDKKLISNVVSKRFAQFFTENQYPVGYSEVDEGNNSSSYERMLKSKNLSNAVEEKEHVIEEQDLDDYNQSRNQIVNIISETASVADERGLIKQASQLDALLEDLL